MKGCAVLFVILTSLCIAGCNSKPSLVGDWSGNLGVSNVTLDMSFHFNQDGTVSVSQSAGGMGSTQKGTYKEDEKEKTVTITATSMESPSIPKAQLDKINELLAKQPQTATFDLEWKDSDTIAIKQRGARPPLDSHITLKRKK